MKEIESHKYRVLIEILVLYHERLEKNHYVVEFQQEQAEETKKKQRQINECLLKKNLHHLDQDLIVEQ